MAEQRTLEGEIRALSLLANDLKLSKHARAFMLWLIIYDDQMSKTEFLDGVFKVRNEDLDNLTEFGRKARESARNELIEKGILKYQSFGQYRSGKYELVNLEERLNQFPSYCSKRDNTETLYCSKRGNTDGTKRDNIEDSAYCTKSDNTDPLYSTERDNTDQTYCSKRDTLISINKSINKTNYEEIQAFYNENRGNGRKATGKGNERKNFQALVNSGVTMERIKKAILNARTSAYCQGHTKDHFVVNLTAILNPENFEKYETGYYNKSNQKEGSGTDPASYMTPWRKKEYEENLQEDYDWFYNTPLEEM